MNKLAVFASGNGSNFEAIAKFKNRVYQVELLICDNKGALAIKRAIKHKIPYFVFNPSDYDCKDSFEQAIIKVLQAYNIDFIALAGYMRLIGKTLLEAYKMRIVNIHPSLLPAFPGLNAIENAVNYNVKVTGVTVHYVDQGMDTGRIIAQRSIKVKHKSAQILEKTIHKIEHRLYKRVLSKIIRRLEDESIN